jgi:serine protease Do
VRLFDVIVEVAGVSINTATDVKKRIDQLKKDGNKTFLMRVFDRDSDRHRFVSLNVE